MKKYYALAAAGRQADIYIFDDIVTPDEKAWRELWGENAPVSGYSLVKDIASLDVDVINVHINSYGGVVSEGLAIYNSLKQHKAYIRTYNDGFCCSAAMLPWLAGDERITSSAAAFLFHQVLTSATGNADELREIADGLETLTNITMLAYMANANISEEEMRAIFKAGSFLTPDYVKQIGLATKVEDYRPEQKASASIKGNLFQSLFLDKKGLSVDVKIIDLPEFQQAISELRNEIKKQSHKENLEPIQENKPMKFLNALFGGKER